MKKHRRHVLSKNITNLSGFSLNFPPEQQQQKSRLLGFLWQYLSFYIWPKYVGLLTSPWQEIWSTKYLHAYILSAEFSNVCVWWCREQRLVSFPSGQAAMDADWLGEEVSYHGHCYSGYLQLLWLDHQIHAAVRGSIRHMDSICHERRKHGNKLSMVY